MKRREKRKERQEKKDEEKKRRDEELKRLKNIKKKEITDKLKEIQKITDAKGAFDVEDLVGEFDSEAYDKKMAEIFNDEYYEKEGDLRKPVFDEEEDDDDDMVNVVENNNEESAEGETEGSKKKKNRSGYRAAKDIALKEKKQELNEYLNAYYKLDYEDLVRD